MIMLNFSQPINAPESLREKGLSVFAENSKAFGWLKNAQRLRSGEANYATIRREETGKEPDPKEPDFLQEELELAAALYLLFSLKAPDIKAAFIEAVGGQFSNVPAALNLAGISSPIWSIATTAQKAEIMELLSKAMARGATDLGAGTAGLQGLTRIELMKESLAELQKAVLDDYFAKIVTPEILNAYSGLLASSDLLTNNEALSKILTLFDKVMARESYFRTVATGQISRAYHYGAVKSVAISQTYKYYEYVAVLDERTTDICRSLNGRRFPISKAVTYYEQILSYSNEDLKRLAPFPENKSYETYTEEQLIDEGVIAPPQHFNCRSTLRFVNYQ